MSYKSKKLRKNKINQLKYELKKIKIALLKIKNKYFKKEDKMRLPQVIAIMKELRRVNKLIRPNNKKIDEWVDNYINECVLYGRKVEILVQWCISLGLEKRKMIQGGRFFPTKAETKLISKEMPKIINIFLKNGVESSWLITFNRSFVDRRRINEKTLEEYMTMIADLVAENKLIEDRALFVDWEKDVLGRKPRPNLKVFQNFSKLISDRALKIELKNFIKMLQCYPDMKWSEEELKEETRYRIACEAEEGRYLTSTDSPFRNGNFVLIPFELPERYVFFSFLAPNFQKRIVSVLKPYPWRLS